MKLDNIPLCSFWSKEKLLKRYEEIGERAFVRGFRQQPISEGELTFPHFDSCIRYEPIEEYQYCFTGVDLSSEKRKGNVIFTIGINNIKKKFPIDIQSGHWSSPEMAEQIKDVYAKFKPQVILVENNAYQQALIDWLTTKGFEHIPVMAYTTGKQKMDGEIGLPSLDVQFEKQYWIFYVPKHEVGCRCIWCRFVREYKGHPGYESDDIVMAMWLASEALRKYGIRDNNFVDYDKGSPGTMAGMRNKRF